MPSFHVIKESKINDSYLTNLMKSKFDLNIDKIKEEFTGNINIEDINWNIGVIVGNSGTGKSTIVKEIFGNHFINKQFDEKSIIDNMDSDNFEEICKIFNQVGFSSPPSWLKPYNVLSNGEKMRVDLAYSLLSKNDIIIFDEFTSVVDRSIAKIGSCCVSKNIKKFNRKFIAVSCHYDILEWLEPDWIFDTNSMEFKETRGLLRRPKINLEIRKCTRELWRYFKKYHYLNSTIGKQSQCYCLLCNDNLAGFIGIIHFPHPHIKNMKKVTRLVVLPDYQGIGLGKILLEEIGEIYKKNYRFSITTSQPSLISYFIKSEKWKCKSFGRFGHQGRQSQRRVDSNGRFITSWELK